MNNSEIKEVMEGLVQWHQNRVANCCLIIDKTDADLCLKTDEGREIVIPAESDKARFIRLGVELALAQFMTFPLSINTTSEDEEGYGDE